VCRQQARIDRDGLDGTPHRQMTNITPHPPTTPPTRRRALLRQAANALSLSRFFIGAAAYLMLSGAHGAGVSPPPGGAAAALVLVLAAALTDYLDGVMARRAGAAAETTSSDWFGRWIDAFTDFFLFLCVYGALLRAAVVPVWLYALFLAREGVMYLMFRPAAVRLGLDHGARRPGKVKTVLQYAGVIGLLAVMALAPHLGLSTGTVNSVATGTMAVLVAVSLGSLYWYLRPLFQSWPQPQRGLPEQLCAALLGLTLLQLLLFRGLAPDGAPWAPFLVGTILFHVTIGGLLFWRHREFAPVDPSGGGRAARLTLPNTLTLVRLSSIPTLTLLLAVGPRPGTVAVLVAVAAGVFLTDLFDGALARRRRQVTPIGGYLDSGSDYLVLLALAVLLAAKGILPSWLALLLCTRLVLHALAMGVLVLRHGLAVARPTTWGKISVAAAMVLITLELLAHAAAAIIPSAGGTGALLLARGLQAAELATAVLIVISLADKLRYFLHTLRAARAVPAPDGERDR